MAVIRTTINAAAALCLAATTAHAAGDAAVFDARVLAALAGDTVIVRRFYPDSPTPFPCRLYGIMAPIAETRDNPPQPFARDAKKKLGILVKKLPEEVEVRLLPCHDRNDVPYCRILNGEGQDLSILALVQGLAWFDETAACGYEPTSFRQAEAMARQAKVGLWKSFSQTPPWEFLALFDKRPATRPSPGGDR